MVCIFSVLSLDFIDILATVQSRLSNVSALVVQTVTHKPPLRQQGVSTGGRITCSNGENMAGMRLIEFIEIKVTICPVTCNTAKGMHFETRQNISHTSIPINGMYMNIQSITIVQVKALNLHSS